MSFEDEDGKLSRDASVEKADDTQKPRVRYTRNFLLSFSDLDVSKKLPSGFDPVILSEFEGALFIEKQRSLGGLPLQSLKRSDYGSPPYRLENTRGGSGRWDTRSSGSSDRDGDLQSERETFMQDSGRRFGNQSRRFWQHTEHDGLLGSGAFPRPSGYVGTSAPKGRGNGHYQLNRSTEPYQPPRPYKAVPHSRRDNTDSVNDETFGPAECSSQDRAEEERKRRESFELMRKEQHKALQEKHKRIPDDNSNLDTDIIILLDSSEDHKKKQNESKPEDSVAPSHTQSGSSWTSHAHAPQSRPLVPPGFANAVLEKNRPQTPDSSTPEAGSAIVDDKSLMKHADNGHERKNYTNSGLGGIKHSVEIDDAHSKLQELQEANEVCKSDMLNGLSNKEFRSEVMDVSTQSSSILEKLFGGALTTNFITSTNIVEHQGAKTEEETMDPATTESSKFAQWFVDEEKKPVEDFSSSNLLSLIVNKENASSQPSEFSDDKALEPIKPSLPYEDNQTTHTYYKLPAAASAASAAATELYNHGDNRELNAGVLTCEDLEQFILAEVKDSSLSLQQSVQGPLMELDRESARQKANVDDQASQHLLSLLWKGANSKESTSSAGIDILVSSMERINISDFSTSLDLADLTSSKNPEKVQNSEKTLTLEALFGAAFMNELHSVEAPLSVQRGTVGLAGSIDVPHSAESRLPYENNPLFSSPFGEVPPNNMTTEGNAEVSGQTQEVKASIIPGMWLGREDSSTGGGDKGFREAAADIHLPEEDSLFMVNDSLDPISSDVAHIRNVNRKSEPLEANMQQLNDPVLRAIFGDAEHAGQGHLPQPTGPTLLDHPSDLVDSDKLYHHSQGRPSSQFLHQMNHVRPLFPQMDHHMNVNPQMKFMGQEIRPDPHHPFPPNVFPQHGLHNGPQFDPAGPHPFFQHMPVPGNLPPNHPFQVLPRGAPMSYPMNHMPGYVADMNNMHNFPINHRPPNFGGQGMGIQGPLIGSARSSDSQVFDRLLEMELRANLKQMHPTATGHIPGVYGPELDMGFRYR